MRWQPRRTRKQEKKRRKCRNVGAATSHLISTSPHPRGHPPSPARYTPQGKVAWHKTACYMPSPPPQRSRKPSLSLSSLDPQTAIRHPDGCLQLPYRLRVTSFPIAQTTNLPLLSPFFGFHVSPCLPGLLGADRAVNSWPSVPLFYAVPLVNMARDSQAGWQQSVIFLMTRWLLFGNETRAE